MTNVIEVEFPRKPASNLYRCSWRRCGQEVKVSGGVSDSVICPGCAAEMRPVEAK